MGVDVAGGAGSSIGDAAAGADGSLLVWAAARQVFSQELLFKSIALFI